MKYYITYLFLILGFFGCKTENSIEIKTFPKIIPLEGQPSHDITVIGRGVNLSVIDTFLVIQKAEEKVLKIYSTNTHKLLAEYGDSGEGPEEFLDPVLLKQIRYDPENKSPIITVYDYQKGRLNSINILNLIRKQGVVHIQEPLPDIEAYMVYFHFKNNVFLLGTTEEGRFFHYDFGSNEAKIIPYVPKMEFPIKYEDVVYKSAVTVNMDKGLFAAAPIGLAGMDFFDLNGNYLRSTFFDTPGKLEKEQAISANSGISDHFLYIADIDAKGEFIYGLNYNNISSDLNSGNISKLKVQVFDWEGNPIKEYILNDQRVIDSFAVDIKNNRIYGYCPDEKDNNIIIYDMG